VSSDYHSEQIMIFDMSMQDLSSSYFFTPTQLCYQKYRDQWTPAEALDMIMKHVPMGSLLMRLGTAIRTSSSLLMNFDLSQYATLEGMAVRGLSGPLSRFFQTKDNFSSMNKMTYLSN